LEAIAYGGSGNYTYSWSSIPPGFTSDLANPMVGPVDTTTYIVATSDGTTTRHDTVQIKVVFPPTIYAGEDTTLCAWAYSIPVSGSVSNVRDVRWGSFGDGHFIKPNSLITSYIPGIQDKTVGHVDLILTAYALPPCSGKVTDIRQLLIDPCTTIPEPLQDEVRMEINPNPAVGFVNFTIHGLRGNALLTLNGMDGSLRESFLLEPTGKEMVKSLDITGYSKGIYIIRLKSGVRVLTDKLVIR
jgi:hypothetical protein